MSKYSLSSIGKTNEKISLKTKTDFLRKENYRKMISEDDIRIEMATLSMATQKKRNEAGLNCLN